MRVSRSIPLGAIRLWAPLGAIKLVAPLGAIGLVALLQTVGAQNAPAAKPLPPGDWPMYRRDTAGTGHSPLLIHKMDGRTVARIGYDLFAEVHTLLTTGQPVTHAGSLPSLAMCGQKSHFSTHPFLL